MLGKRFGKRIPDRPQAPSTTPRAAAGPASYQPSKPSTGAPAGPQHRSLGEALVFKGVITQAELDEALARERKEGGFVGQILVDLGYVTQDAIVSFLVKECKIPHLSLLDYEVSYDLLNLIPEDVCVRHSLLPIDRLGKILTVAMVDPLDARALALIRELHPDLRIKAILCNWQHFQAVSQKLFADHARYPKPAPSSVPQDVSAPQAESGGRPSRP